MVEKSYKAFDTKDSQITEIRERMTHGTDAWSEIRAEAKTDMLCVAGEPWEALDPAGKKQRDKAHRPMITADELNQYFNQAINGVRANQRAVKFSPVRNGADEEGSEFYADKWREIEYRSKAQMSYITAFENAVQRSYGFCRVNTRWESERSKDQDIWVEPIHNPDMVLLDPEGQSPDSSDIKWGFIYETWKHTEFVRRYGDKFKTTDFSSYIAEAPAWIQPDELILAEYWKVKTKPRQLYLLTGPNNAVDTVFADELKESGLPLGFQLGQFLRDVDYPSVYQCLTNGIETLEEKPWPGKYIPIVSCYGKVLYVNGKRVILSMTRLARDPYMLYCYYRTQQAEMAGMIPKTPVQAYEGQMAGFERDWQKAAHEPVAFLYFKGMTDATGNNILPPPSRLDYHAGEHLQALELCAEGARRAIQSAMATNFMPTQAQRKNEKSGKALDKIDEVAQRGSFHFNDHYDDMVTQVGVIGEDLLDKIYDTDREVGIRKKNDESMILRINAPSQDKDGKPIHISTKGDYQVTVSTGPAFDSTREAESEFADVLMETPFAPMIADLVVKLKGGGPVLDEIAERLTPPQFKKQKDGQPDPQQIMQMVQKQKAENDNLKQILSELAMTIKTKKLEIESHERIALEEMKSRERIAASKDETVLTTTQMKISLEESIALMEAQIAHIQSKLDGHEADLSRSHEMAKSSQEHAQAMQQGQQGIGGEMLKGEQGQVNALQQGQQGHQQALEEMAAQPKPVNGSGA